MHVLSSVSNFFFMSNRLQPVAINKSDAVLLKSSFKITLLRVETNYIILKDALHYMLLFSLNAQDKRYEK